MIVVRTLLRPYIVLRQEQHREGLRFQGLMAGHDLLDKISNGAPKSSLSHIRRTSQADESSSEESTQARVVGIVLLSKVRRSGTDESVCTTHCSCRRVSNMKAE